MNASITPVRQAAFSFLALALSTLMSCQHEKTVPAPITPDKPGSSTVTQPGQNTTTPGTSTATQPADSVVAKRTKISWSDSDFLEILYNAAGRPVQYASQYLYNSSTGYIQRFVYKLRYNADNQLTRVDVSGGTGSSYVLYQYKGNQVSETNEYSTAGHLIGTCAYQYCAPNRLSQVDETRSLSKSTERRTYEYDARGNLSLVSFHYKKAATDAYALHSTLAFSEYDTQRDVENLIFHNPLPPNVVFRTNNHGLKIIRDQNGVETSRERTVYVYNEQGYPVEQVRTGPGGRLVGTYTY